MSTLKRLYSLGLAVALLVACAGPGQRQMAALASQHGLQSSMVSGTEFTHQVFINRSASAPGTHLHVYIEGDGSPWLGKGRPAIDPTARNPLMLQLMTMDPGPAIYLGRPCYGQARQAAACNPWVWTHGRFAAEVVASMVTALRQLNRTLGERQLVLIGHSGGGSLAMLMAARMPRVSAVVTLAGNLDTDAWSAHHGYSRLSGSLNPSLEAPLARHIRQWHWVGAEDKKIPPALIRQALQTQAQARLEVLPGLDHQCCWPQLWPQLVRQLMQEELAADAGGNRVE